MPDSARAQKENDHEAIHSSRSDSAVCRINSISSGRKVRLLRHLEGKHGEGLGPKGSGLTTIADYTYATDGVGNITQIHDAVDPTYNRDFAYDDLNRLITANTGRGS